MNTTEFLQDLRRAQRRAAQEQQILSGQDFILMAGLVQFVSALHPFFLLVYQRVLGSAPRAGLGTETQLVAELSLAGLLALLGWWAHYAPFRAAATAVVAFILVHGSLGLVQPSSLLSGAIVKSLMLVGLLHAARTGYQRHRAL